MLYNSNQKLKTRVEGFKKGHDYSETPTPLDILDISIRIIQIAAKSSFLYRRYSQ